MSLLLSAPCCVCPPTCETDETGDTCIDAACGFCLHGCPAGLDRPCCREADDDPDDATPNLTGATA